MLRPILFNTEMVRAIMAGRKRYTRRICRGDKPPFERGDILWVRETWSFLPCITCQAETECCELAPDPPDKKTTADGETDGCFLYRADGEDPIGWGGCKWRPAIHMPKEAARIFFRVAFIRRSKLQESILGGDGSVIQKLWAEGVNVGSQCREHIRRSGYPCCTNQNERCDCQRRPLDNFVKLWDSTVPKYKLDVWGWDADPEVWVIRLERCDKEGRTRDGTDSPWASPLCRL